MKRFGLHTLAIALFFHVAVVAQDVSKDIELGKQGYQMVEEEMGFCSNEPVEELLNAIGQKLENQLDKPLFDYEFYLVDSPEPNAFAIPGGKVFVTRGLLALPLTEDELAGVIGHEIIHANNRHGVKQQRGNIFGKIIAIPGVIIGGIFRGPIGTAIASPFLYGNALLQADYSRGHEKEADKEGTLLAAKAGYQPYDLARFLTRLSQESELLSGQMEEESYFSSHPYTPKRVKAITKYSETYKQAKPSPVLQPSAFLKALDGVMIGPNPTYGFIKNDVFYHPQHLFSMQVDSNWQTAITPTSFSLGHNQGDAIVSIVVDQDSLSHSMYLKKFEESMQKQTKMTPSNREEFTWHRHKGAVVEYITEADGDRIKFQTIAVDYTNGKLLKISSLYAQKRQAEVEQVLESTHVIQHKDLPKTEVLTLKVVEAFKDETFKGVVMRSGSTQHMLLQMVINEKSENTILEQGELIKVVNLKKFSF